MQNKTKRSLLLVLLIIVALLLSVSTFSYWAESVAKPDSSTVNSKNITIGSAKEAKTNLNLSKDVLQQGTLVPVGRVSESSGAGSVDKITVEYTVDWKSENTNAAIGTPGTLTVIPGTAKIKDADNLGHLINVSVVENNLSIVADKDPVNVVLEVTLTEPSNKDEYQSIVGKDFIIPLTFEVTV